MKNRNEIILETIVQILEAEGETPPQIKRLYMGNLPANQRLSPDKTTKSSGQGITDFLRATIPPARQPQFDAVVRQREEEELQQARADYLKNVLSLPKESRAGMLGAVRGLRKKGLL